VGFALYDLAAGGGPDYAQQATDAEAKRQQKITQGTQSINKAFSGYTPQFYQNREKAYMDYAMPQFAQQYNTTKGQIGFGIANKGLEGGSAAKKQWSDLARTTAVGQQSLADSARGQAQQLQTDVAGAKNNLLNMLYQSADPASAGAQATATASSFQAPSTFAPIANQFSGLINQYYLSQILNNRPVSAPTTMSGSSGFGDGLAPLPQPSISS
jgi:hypothetical protein